MRIAFTDFWQYPKPFNPNNNFLIHLIRSVKDDVELVSADKADVIIYSIFGNDHKKYNCKKIFFTGENIRPNFEECDFSISFDFDKYDERNIRIPLWYWYIDWFGVGSYDNPDYLIPVKYLYESNEFSKKEKNRFCSAVYSNPVSIRTEFVNRLNQYKKVDCFGKVSGFYNLLDGEKYKLDIISNYKFNICFENSAYPGYYTEKLLQAKIAGCVPIYYSDENVQNDFNKNCFLSYNNIDELIEKIVDLDRNNLIYNEIKNQPLFLKEVNLDLKKEKILKIL
jgi:hypothetical protein